MHLSPSIDLLKSPVPILHLFTAGVRFLPAAGVLLWGASVAAEIYHVDPVSGSMGNNGSETEPWSTLEQVFAAGKIFGPGDEIVLRSGYHGAPTVKGNNLDFVTIRPDTGASPKLRNLVVKSAAA